MAARWRFNREFKVEAVKLVQDPGVSIAHAARCTPTAVCRHIASAGELTSTTSPLSSTLGTKRTAPGLSRTIVRRRRNRAELGPAYLRPKSRAYLSLIQVIGTSSVPRSSSNRYPTDRGSRHPQFRSERWAPA